MDILSIVVFGMIVIILGTITLAVLSYGAFKFRESRAPRAQAVGEESLFFERVRVIPPRTPRKI
jgi:hypothetical protein